MDSKTFLKFAEQCSEDFMRGILDGMTNQKKEAKAMQVTYNDFTGELVKLEQRRVGIANEIVLYDLTLYESEKQAAISFTCVKLEDVKFHSGTVTFGG